MPDIIHDSIRAHCHFKSIKSIIEKQENRTSNNQKSFRTQVWPLTLTQVKELALSFLEVIG